MGLKGELKPVKVRKGLHMFRELYIYKLFCENVLIYKLCRI